MITAIYQFDGSIAGTLLGVFCLSIAIGYGIAAGGTLMLLTKVRASIGFKLHSHYSLTCSSRFMQSIAAVELAWTREFKSSNRNSSAIKRCSKLALIWHDRQFNPSLVEIVTEPFKNTFRQVFLSLTTTTNEHSLLPSFFTSLTNVLFLTHTHTPKQTHTHTHTSFKNPHHPFIIISREKKHLIRNRP